MRFLIYFVNFYYEIQPNTNLQALLFFKVNEFALYSNFYFVILKGS